MGRIFFMSHTYQPYNSNMEHSGPLPDISTMSLEKRIHGKVDDGHHDGLRSTRRRIDAAMSQLSDWRNQRTAVHEGGHLPDGNSLCFPGEIGGHFQIPSGVIFEQPEVIEMMRQNKSASGTDDAHKIEDL